MGLLKSKDILDTRTANDIFKVVISLTKEITGDDHGDEIEAVEDSYDGGLLELKDALDTKTVSDISKVTSSDGRRQKDITDV